MPQPVRMFSMHRHRPCWRTVRKVAALIRRGNVVAMPTDTVYGLAADPFSADAGERIYEVKGRPKRSPIPLLISDREHLEKLADPPELLDELAAEFWPGPLTVILKAKPAVPEVITAGGGTVAVRLPAGEPVRAVIREAGGCVTGTSANRSGQPAAATAAEVKLQLGGGVYYIVDGGRARLRRPSTIVDLTSAPSVVRHGAVPWPQVARYLR